MNIEYTQSSENLRYQIVKHSMTPLLSKILWEVLMMTITKHAIERFKERITWEDNELVKNFIKHDIENSELLYRINDTEKRLVNGIVYVVNCQNSERPVVITLYLQ